MYSAELWKNQASHSQQAAQLLYDSGFYRDSVSRAYYASYQAATAVSVDHGDAANFPTGWNNPSHEQLPELIRNNRNVPLSARREVCKRLRYLRNAREDADYRPGHTVDSSTARDCLRALSTVFRYLQGDYNEPE